jgi:translation initiation factor 1
MTSPKPPRPAGSPFQALEALRSQLPAGEANPASVPAPTPPIRGPLRAVVRYERKGRGGKEATVIEKLGLAPKVLEVWCRELKQALGCGGLVDDDNIVLQGDLRARLPALLSTRGVGKVTVS